MIRIRTEWIEAPGVQDLVLARTWCRLVIVAGGNLVTELIDSRSESIRGGVFGSAFPLAEWVVEHWWNLLYEPCPFPGNFASRDLARSEKDRAWVQRHSLLAAREGMALPDLMLYRDGDEIVGRWDQEIGSNAINPYVRFIAEGQVRMTPAMVEEGLAQFVMTVIGRLDGVEDEDAKRLKESWAAITFSRREEADLCTSAATLGLDPYDSRELTNDLADFLTGDLMRFDARVRSDLLEAASVEHVRQDVVWLRAAADCARQSQGLPIMELARPAALPTTRAAFELGYRLAQNLRSHLSDIRGTDPINDIRAIAPMYAATNRVPGIQAPENTIDSFLGPSVDGHPILVGAFTGDDTRRFAIARSLYLWNFSREARRSRLLTEAHTWDQKASRAFAAELLAPAAGLRQRVTGRVPWRDVEALASDYHVSPKVILHQLENHRIAWVDSV